MQTKLCSMLKLSIIVPVYNVEPYIRPCIESIFNQGLDEKDYEVIIVNDGSTDKSMEMITDIISQHNNIIIINQENQGLSMARNNGIEKASGEYIQFVDSDDLLIDNSLKPILKIAIDSQADLVVADFLRMTDEDIKHKGDLIPNIFPIVQKETTGYELFLGDIIPNECYVWRTLYKKDFILSKILRFIPGIHFEDVPFTYECYLKAPKCIRTNRLLNIYRAGHQSASAPSSFNMKKAKDLCFAITKSWELRNIEGLPDDVKNKFIDSAYILYSNLLYRTLYGIKDVSQKVNVLKMLKGMAHSLKFTNNLKQVIASFLFRFAPRILIYSLLIRNYLKKITNR